MQRHRWAWLKQGIFGLAIVLGATAADARPKADAGTAWVGTWASAQMRAEQQNMLAKEALTNATLRQLVRVSLGGRQLRVRVSNLYGTTPLKIGRVHVALAVSPSSPDIDPKTDRALTFSGQREITVPAGAEYISDPVDLPVQPLATIAVSMHIIEPPAVQTGHPGSRATSYLATGDHTSDAKLAAVQTVDRWYHLSAVDVKTDGKSAAAVFLGDSITDGYGVKPNTNMRWTDFLTERLQATPKTSQIGVLNLGIGGNRLLLDGLGPNTMARFEHDVLGQASVKYLFLLIGVNDLGTLTRDGRVPDPEHEALVRRMLTGYDQIIRRARERGIRVIGATILPYGASGYYKPDARNEADRRAINDWLRKPGTVDALVDFDLIMRDPARPDRLRPDYDSGDGLHPSAAGYKAMAEAVPLSLFSR